MSPVKAFDRWAASGDLSYLDLAVYRIIYSGVVLVSLPQIVRLSEFPRSFFDPPFGPLQLLPDLPSRPVLLLIQILLALSLACLVVGFHTVTASLATGILLAASYGLSYSYGKIDHTIILVLVPLVVCWSGWGNRLSYDNAQSPGAVVGSQRAPQWPLRFLAVLIGLAFLTAAKGKFDSGWLSLSTQSARGHFLRRNVSDGEPEGLSSWLFSMNSSVVWESIDWMTVGLEASIILAVITWRTFRILLACACLFHLGIMLTLGITFSYNVIAYGSFVGWAGLGIGGRQLFGRFRVGDIRVSRSAVFVLISGLTAGALYFQDVSTDDMRSLIKDWVVFAGAFFAVAYLVAQVGRLWKHRGRRLGGRALLGSVGGTTVAAVDAPRIRPPVD